MYPSSDIYGGLAGIYDYGHLGTLLKRNFENTWRTFFLNLHHNYYEIETANVMHENVFRASGHLENFIDPIAKCSKCGNIERADHLVEKELKKRVEELTPGELTSLIKKHNITCHKCHKAFEPVTVLNMMFPVIMGVGKQTRAYLRPETAQGPYVNFKTQFELQRKKLPLGLALIGRAYRNEISPRHFTLRQREFTQSELQIFFDPDTIDEHPDFNSIKNKKLNVVLVGDRRDGVKEVKASDLNFPKFYVYHLAKIQEFYFDVLKVDKKKFRLYQLNDKEKAFYNKYHFDVEVDLHEVGWTEVGGLHYRTNHDLEGHEKVSGESMHVTVNEKKFIPHVLELSFGVDRNTYMLVDQNYEERDHVVLGIPSKLTPFFCAVFPLVKNKHSIVKKAKQVYGSLIGYSCFYDEVASVGRRYARADEIGIRYCITVDFDTLDDNSVTIRDRESTKQIRIKIDTLLDTLFDLMQGKKFEDSGKIIK
tara:strand:- start:204 stop:1640 length:1437 start_codon:yes stop_codon:yes gene_type:complete